MKRILIILLATLLAAGFSACQKRGDTQPKQRGARENVVVAENPRIPLDEVQTRSTPEPEEEPPPKDERPEELVRGMLESVKTGDKIAIQRYVDYNALFSGATGQDDDWHYRHILQNVTYQVLSSDVENEVANVWVKVTNIDMGVVLPEFWGMAMRLEYDNALSEEPVGSQELEAEYRNLFAGLVEANKNGVIERLVDVTVKKTGDEWKIIPKEDLSNALLGGYLSVKIAAGENAQPVTGEPGRSSSNEDPFPMQAEHPPADEDFFFSQIDRDFQ
ncbi:MAG: hypothetical protein FWG94_05770 [Oscillospiraceae bacterium]|nr:hypothetical protein [Oscillospiraceae bacterium]